MITNKYINVIVVTVICIAAGLCILAAFYAEGNDVSVNGEPAEMEYERELFDTSSVMTVNILMDDSDWQDMIDNALDEEYYACDVEINGTDFYNVGIRPKGNTSLSTIAAEEGNDRYSFKLEFDQYVDGQTCFGLDKLILNNSYADNTNMKEAVVYDMYSFLDVDASLYNYAQIYVNGEYWGVYLALEAVEESFIERNYGSDAGKLYKPDSMDMGDAFEYMEMPENVPKDMPGEMPNIPEQRESQKGEPKGFSEEKPGERPESEDFDPEKIKDFGGMPGGMNNNGSDLNYADDDLESYSAIWDGEVIDSSDSDNRRVVKALKNISESNELEKYMDVENVIKYMAVHTFAVNLDSLSGSMAHNYYLYETCGRLNMIPWDYNLAFGGFQEADESSTVNFPIDTPFSEGIELSDRDFFAAVLENDEYLEKYHEYLRILTEEYVNGGVFDAAYNRIRTQLDQLVKDDPTAMQTYDEYISGADMLYNTVKLRSQSILGQLNGEIPSTKEGQAQDSSALIDSSSIDLSVMGTMDDMMGGKDMMNGKDFMPGGREDMMPPGDFEKTEDPQDVYFGTPPKEDIERKEKNN